MNHTKSKISVRTMALVGVLTALVFAASMISIPLGETARIHLGNILCLLSGLLFGPAIGGITAGLGSMFYDFTDPRFMPEFWITFLMKFSMGFVAGLVARRMQGKRAPMLRYGLGAIAGQLLYIVLYLTKSAIMQHFVLGNPWVAVKPILILNGTASLINGGISVVVAVLLAPVLTSALEAAGLFQPPAQHRPA